MNIFKRILGHNWQHYGVNYIEESMDKYDTTHFHLVSFIEHFRACKNCGIIERRNPETKQWELYL